MPQPSHKSTHTYIHAHRLPCRATPPAFCSHPHAAQINAVDNTSVADDDAGSMGSWGHMLGYWLLIDT